MKTNKRHGISLIVLVITIIIMIILAAAIILSLNASGIIGKANEAKNSTNNAVVLQAASMYAAEWNANYELGETKDSAETYIKTKLDNEGFSQEQISVLHISDDGTVKLKGTWYTMYTDTEKATAPIPDGFTVSNEPTEQTVSTGLVIVDKNGNEFVWIPVPNAIYDGTTEIVVGTYTPMAKAIGETKNYQGLLYDLDQATENQQIRDYTTNGVGTVMYREPSLVTGNKADLYAVLNSITGDGYDAANYNLAGSYSSAIAFGQEMQDEYNNMIESINTHKGFYVGRYETGIEDDVAVSKNANVNSNVTTADASQTITQYWYGLYNKQRTMATDHELISVESSMIWGSQYDAMMNWMIKRGKTVGTGYDNTIYNTTLVTGKSSTDVINNIYDLYGCHNEWTIEAFSTNSRSIRGGRYSNGDSYSPSRRGTNDVIDASNNYRGSRLALYIKLR